MNNIKISKNVINKIKKTIFELSSGPVMVHSNLLGVMRLVTIQNNLNIHLDIIKEITNQQQLWFASFDNQWVETKKFSVMETPSIVGVLNEYFRKNVSEWRTEVPLASFCGVKNEPYTYPQFPLDIYGDNSLFYNLILQDGIILHYGSGFHDTTFIHFVEQSLDKPLYRFDKIFNGSVIDRSGHEKKLSIQFHCRPNNKHLNYNWVKIEKELIEIGAVKKFDNEDFRIVIISAKMMVDYCKDRLKSNPLYLLDEESLKWIIPALNNYGRRFVKEDFE